MFLRIATLRDQDAIHAVHWAAFPPEECEPVAQLAVDLLDTATNPGTTSWVAEIDQEVVGHVAFSPVTSAAHPDFRGAILAPVAVKPSHHRRGIARTLIEQAIRHEKEQGTEVVLVYGDPAFYGRFGFTVEAAEGLKAPFPLEFPFGWQGIDFRTSPVLISDLTCVPSLQREELW